jgi:hypothetical protein
VSTTPFNSVVVVASVYVIFILPNSFLIATSCLSVRGRAFRSSVIVASASDCHVPISRGSPLRDLLKCTVIQINAITTRRTPAAARISRLLALAHRLDELVRTGVVTDYATLAELAHVSRARMSQILNLLVLASDIQEALLFLPRTVRGRDPIHLRQLQPIVAVVDWEQQRNLWRSLRTTRGLDLPR